MQTVILAGGLGTRLSSKTSKIPKPLIRVGGHPILWHLMKIYSHYGYSNFIICGGYKVNQTKKYGMETTSRLSCIFNENY